MTDRPYRVAVIGAGPSGVYTADTLTKQQDLPVEVDVIDRLPTPFGLVRYGVAPDHLKIRSVSNTLQKVLERPMVRFLGNVRFGDDITLEELRGHYDAVVFAVGAARDRRMGIPGEDLTGSLSSTDFVAWYCGHPDTTLEKLTLTAEAVAVVGVGNVAVDVARILVRDVAELRTTDIHDEVLDVLAASSVTDVHVFGRRGPAQAKWTTKELRELGDLADVDVVVRPEDLVLDPASEAEAAAHKEIARNVEVLRGWAEREPKGAPRRIHLWFWSKPVEVLGTDRVEGFRVERTRLDESGRVVGTGEVSTVEVQMVVRSVGYRGAPLPGLPFDDDRAVIPSEAGRMLRDGAVAPGEYVAGWVKRGPTGVIGTNKADGAETAQSILADLAALPRAPAATAEAVDALLRERGVRVVTLEGWNAIDAAEIALGQAQGRERVKIAQLEKLLAACPAPRSS